MHVPRGTACFALCSCTLSPTPFFCLATLTPVPIASQPVEAVGLPDLWLPFRQNEAKSLPGQPEADCSVLRFFWWLCGTFLVGEGWGLGAHPLPSSPPL